MAVSTKSRQMILIRSPFGEVRLPRKYVPLLRVGAIVLFVLSVIAVVAAHRADRQLSLVHSAHAA